MALLAQLQDEDAKPRPMYPCFQGWTLKVSRRVAGAASPSPAVHAVGKALMEPLSSNEGSASGFGCSGQYTSSVLPA